MVSGAVNRLLTIFPVAKLTMASFGDRVQSKFSFQLCSLSHPVKLAPMVTPPAIQGPGVDTF